MLKINIYNKNMRKALILLIIIFSLSCTKKMSLHKNANYNFKNDLNNSIIDGFFDGKKKKHK